MPEAAHSPPLIFDVEADPAEAWPLAGPALPDGLVQAILDGKAAAEAALTPTSISAEWGYEYALCCGYGCTPPCVCECTNVPLT